MTNTTNTADVRGTIRASGGIVHSDGNIFFTSGEQFLAAARAALAAPAQAAPANEALKNAALPWPWKTDAEVLDDAISAIEGQNRLKAALRSIAARTTPAASPAQADERKAFEGWVAASGRAHMLKRDDRNDWYADLTVTAWWTAWQARAAQEGK